MHTRSQTRNLHNQQHQAPPVVEQFNLEEPIENPDPLAPMADNRTMAQLLEAPHCAYKGPTIHTTSSPKVVEREPEVTKDTMHPTNNGSTKDIPPPVVPIVHHESILCSPQMLPVSALKP
ncbi:hypothetical protein Tco_0846131 [Tanacetum coccineum]